MKALITAILAASAFPVLADISTGAALGGAAENRNCRLYGECYNDFDSSMREHELREQRELLRQIRGHQRREELRRDMREIFDDRNRLYD